MPSPVSRILALYERLTRDHEFDDRQHRHTLAGMKWRRAVIHQLTDAMAAEGRSLTLGEQSILAQYASGNMTKRDMLSHLKLNVETTNVHWSAQGDSSIDTKP